MSRSALNRVEDRALDAIDYKNRPKPERCPLTADADRAYHAMRKVKGNVYAMTWAGAKAHWSPERINQARKLAEQTFAKITGAAE